MSRVSRLAALVPGALARGVGRRVARGATVSVVVAVTEDSAPFLDDCVRGLASQTRRPCEIVLATAGAGGQAEVAVRRQVRASWRVHAVAAGSVATAVDQAVRRTRGDFLWILAAGDQPVTGAVERLAGTLERSGSDLAVSGLAGGVACDLLGQPAAAAVPGLEQRMLRRSCYDRRMVEALDGELAWWLPGVLAQLAARTFDCCEAAVTTGPRRGSGVPFGTMPVLAPAVPELVRGTQEVAGRLAGLSEAAHGEFSAWMLGQELPRWLEDVERCTAQEWQLLSSQARVLWEAARPSLRAAVHSELRVRAWLAVVDRRADLERLAAARWREDSRHPTLVRDGRALAVLPVEGVPEEVLELAEDETALRIRLLSARRVRSRLEVVLMAWVSGVGGQHGATVARLWLVAEDGRRTALDTRLRRDPEVNVVAADRFQDHSLGVVTGACDLAALAGPVATATLEVTMEVAGLTRRARLALDDQLLEDAERGGSAVVDEILLEDTELVLRGSAPAAEVIELRGGSAMLRTELSVAGGRFEGRLLLQHDPWSLGRVPVPTRDYGLHLLDGAGQEQRLALGDGLAGRQPLTLRSASFRVRVRSGPGRLVLALSAPLADVEVGPFAQHRLQQRYACGEHSAVDPEAVYLQSYTGQSATDSPLAIHHALRRTHPHLRLRWGVADRATRLPEGAEPVLIRSREWYATLATSGAIVVNADLEPWFTKRPGQRVLQTFHGYPSKTMGVAAWEAKNLTPLRVEKMLQRTSGTWDLLLTPTPAMDRHYRTQYRYTGPIHSYGYPRDDALVAPDAEEIRRTTRHSLGVGERHAILYAPTWRDDLATGFRSARTADLLDLDRAAAALGDRYLFLVRGHRFHGRRPRAGDRLLDVTDYPDVNDLILAADAAVLDYSSLRFDFALTGRPMVFLVPDLERYERNRGFLHPFAPSAPGPLLDSTDEVVEELGDLDALSARHRPAYERFSSEFNAYQDGHAAERVVAAFFGPPSAPGAAGADV